MPTSADAAPAKNLNLCTLDAGTKPYFINWNAKLVKS